MFRYAKQLGRELGRLVRDEIGQNLIETALIIGVITLVLVFGFLTTDITAAVGNVSKQVACEIQGGIWTGDAAGNTGSCANP